MVLSLVFGVSSFGAPYCFFEFYKNKIACTKTTVQRFARNSFSNNKPRNYEKFLEFEKRKFSNRTFIASAFTLFTGVALLLSRYFGLINSNKFYSALDALVSLLGSVYIGKFCRENSKRKRLRSFLKGTDHNRFLLNNAIRKIRDTTQKHSINELNEDFLLQGDGSRLTRFLEVLCKPYKPPLVYLPPSEHNRRLDVKRKGVFYCCRGFYNIADTNIDLLFIIKKNQKQSRTTTTKFYIEFICKAKF